MSTSIAGSAIKDGYKNVRVFLDGEPAWLKAGGLWYTNKDNIENGNIVLIDLRSDKESEAGRIPRSVTIPYDSLEDRIDDIPIKAPVVIYGTDAATAFEDLRDEGYKKVSLVPGGYAGWVKNGGAVATGPLTTEINWVRKLGKGEVSKADFLKAANGTDTSAVILDVRTPDESASGKFKDAIAVPLDQIGANLNKIPKDKKIYVHCTTGARADMAAQELKKNGYDAYFLVAAVECEGNECEIED